MLTRSHLDDEYASLKRIAEQDAASVESAILHHLAMLTRNGARPEYVGVILTEMVKRLDADQGFHSGPPSECPACAARPEITPREHSEILAMADGLKRGRERYLP